MPRQLLDRANRLVSSAFSGLLYTRATCLELEDGNITTCIEASEAAISSNSTGGPVSNLTNVARKNATRPYYTGLHGVNLELDKQMIQFLWISIILVILLVLVVRLWQLFQAYIRRIYCMTCKPSQQRYYTVDHNMLWPWLKQHLIYAPLGKKRHNQELQLSSATNYGTIPSRIHTLLLTLYLLSNIVYLLVLDYRNPEKGAVMAELRGRSGILATVNMVPLVVLASRNNPAIPLLRVSFDTFNLFHRWIGRIVAIESLVHFVAWLVAFTMAKGPEALSTVFENDLFLQFGMLGLVGIMTLPLHSFSVLRHAFYESFLHLHQALAYASILGVYIHLESKKLPAYPFILAVVLYWLSERILRLTRLIYLNRNRQGDRTTTTVEALPSGACRVTFQLPGHITIRPGSHVYAYFPTLSLWMSHPFSVAWTNIESEPPIGSLNEKMHADSPKRPAAAAAAAAPLRTPNSLERQGPPPSRPPTSVSLIVVARTGLTRTLYDAARASPTRTIRLRGAIEGPYAGHESLLSYGTVLMFAGGAGITHHLIQIRHLLAGAHAETVATRKIVLVWSIRDSGAMDWVKPWMAEIMRMPARREVLRIVIYVSKPRENERFRRAKETIRVVEGRVRPGDVLDEFLPHRIGATMVSVCGPGALADEVRLAVRQRLQVGYVDLSEESFTW